MASIYLPKKKKKKEKARTNAINLKAKNKDKQKVNMALSKAKDIVSSNPVVVFSKSYCGYSQRVKQLLSQLNGAFKVIELDQESDGENIQAALAEWTGQKTVPNVFIGGKHIGGCDAILEKHEKEELVPLLNSAGAIANNSGQL